MDEFKPKDELKPDTSDRRPPRSRKAASGPKVTLPKITLPKLAISRQYMMIGVGVVVLILLILGLASALKSPSHSDAQNTKQPVSGNANGERSIDLSGSSSVNEPAQGNNAEQPAAPQELNIPQIAPTPTEAQPVSVPDNQQRVELPGDLNTALSGQQGQVDAVSRSEMGLSDSQAASHQPAVAVQQPAKPEVHKHKPVVSKPAAPATGKPVLHTGKPEAPVRHSPGPVVRKPAASTGSNTVAQLSGQYTLQLSSASRSDTLNAWAKKQNLRDYHVYQTTRDGKPWYVLVTGSYSTTAEAKRAVASLPADVQAKKPWVKPVSLVKKEAAK